ncbi:hypothetical protein LOZ53_004722 [Ophidiomyces ophidiicola]|uniref:Uncharacterized protein n=1 Tax=Ophidiomyces ophidiicola TaxID=1387563 RepID=A0ACB8UWI4_9EURO|nr:hypothetical protein LOZ61_000502 [Ophidiomyces ophidiicola]KAI1924334.1 hypothetical protein LOZ64_000659 [Ophidiomyces ophidiicola]KAI1929235.1 hypothetical protein LOZ60_001704 [Ophidiomyces ophidiicola]KAI1957706.1 hypothetical protein LOZ59_003808 [Ophidiomyces ophidiicola]KAI1974901.1 hypothetical protein LOZ56_000929 [Ophidiomyces ophidiicola]
MFGRSEDYYSAYDVILWSKIAEIEKLALFRFINHAGIPDHGGRYVLQKVAESPDVPLETTLLSIWEEWLALAWKVSRDDNVSPEIEAALRERDDNHCCIKGTDVDTKPTYIIAPSIVEDPALQPGGSLRPILEAFLTEETIKELFESLTLRGKENELKNMWLMSPIARSAFRHGHYSIIKSPHLERGRDGASLPHGGWWIVPTTPGEMSLAVLNGNEEFYKTPSTPNPDSHPLPLDLFVHNHGKLTKPLHLLGVMNRIKGGWRTRKDPRTVGKAGRLILRFILLLLPVFLRLALYQLIFRWADRLIPSQAAGFYVKFLPFGICLKKGGRNAANEANSLLLVEKYTTINAPRLIDSVMIDEQSGFVLMTEIFGDRLEGVYYRTTYEERKQIGQDLAEWISQLRRIPNKTNYLIADTLGEPLTDHRFGGKTWGPFNTVADFTDRLVKDVPNIQKLKHELPLSVLYQKKYDIVFTQSDLHMRNIFLKNGKLHGLIDFESGSFRPEYWEFTRAVWPYGGDVTPSSIYRFAFGEKYKEELEAETYILLNGPFIC